MKVSVIGLGKLGLCTATSFASGGIDVIGVDTSEYIVESLKKKECPIDETGLSELISNYWDKLDVTYSIDYAVQNSDVAFIIVPTPSQENGKFTNKYIETVLKEISESLKTKDKFFVIDVVSTVMPGSCDNEFIPMIEELSGKKCGENFGVVYNPEFIALGSVLQNFLNPDMILIGASDDESSNMVREVYEKTCHNNPEYHQMNLVNAEITKLSLNCYVTMKISYANELASICENVKGADVDVVTSAVGSDSRVGKKYIKGGLGFGGPCFPRDNQAFQAFGRDNGIETRLSPNVVSINKSVVDRLSKFVDKTPKNSNVSVLGLSYKPNTHIIEESQSIELIEQLLEKGCSVKVHDPMAIESTKAVFGEKIEYFNDIENCCKVSDAIYIMTDWAEYEKLNFKDILKVANNNCLIVDAWRKYKNQLESQDNYFCLGFGN